MSQIRFEEQQYNTESLDAGLWKRIFVLMRPLRKELVRLLILMVAVAGCDATRMGLGPKFATPKALERAGLTVADLDTIEINEAFASQSLACIHDLGLPMEKVNPYGGAMALGHPLGCTGAILVGKAIDRLREIDGKYALITMCIGGGMGAAGILERCEEDKA